MDGSVSINQSVGRSVGRSLRVSDVSQNTIHGIKDSSRTVAHTQFGVLSPGLKEWPLTVEALAEKSSRIHKSGGQSVVNS